LLKESGDGLGKAGEGAGCGWGLRVAGSVKLQGGDDEGGGDGDGVANATQDYEAEDYGYADERGDDPLREHGRGS
jgi:hypothetical protein